MSELETQMPIPVDPIELPGPDVGATLTAKVYRRCLREVDLLAGEDVCLSGRFKGILLEAHWPY